MTEPWAALRFGIWILDRLREWRKKRRPRQSIRLIFQNTDAAPFLIEYDEWVGKKHGLKRCYRVGVENSSSNTVDQVRVIVESFDHIGGGVAASKEFANRRPILARPERSLRVSDNRNNSTSVLSKSSAAHPVMFDFIEEWLPSDSEHTDWAWLCFADENLPTMGLFGKARIVLRLEGDGCEPFTMHFLAQNRTYRAETLADHHEVRLTRLLVRRQD